MNTNTAHNSQLSIDRHQSALVVGLGMTGFSAVRYLRSKGLSVRVIDSREQPPLQQRLLEEFPEVVLELGSLESHLVETMVVVSPGVSLREPMLLRAKQQGLEILGDVELFLQSNTKPLVAITGSNGKSTVTTLVGKMIEAGGLKAMVAGNIGKPVLDALVENATYDVAVLELSSFQLETCKSVPADAAAILNISEDHMDRYDSMGDYILAKARILRGAQRAVLPQYDDALRQITNVGHRINFDLQEPANDCDYGVRRFSNYRWLVRGEQRLMRLRDVPLMGLHNVNNVLSAFALVEFLKLPLERMIEAVKGFRGLAHRMETVARIAEVTWVNDSKATNIGATESALKSLEQPVVWIAGGQGKGADFSQLQQVVDGQLKAVILLGEDADKIEQSLVGKLDIYRVTDMRDAVRQAHDIAERGDVVLLSPACASFDMFKGFEHRGDVFKQCVRALEQEATDV